MADWLAASAEVLERHPEWPYEPPSNSVELLCGAKGHHRLQVVELAVSLPDDAVIWVQQVEGTKSRVRHADATPLAVHHELRFGFRCSAGRCRFDATWSHARLLRLVAGAVERNIPAIPLLDH